jgi:hypothetical protein
MRNIIIVGIVPMPKAALLAPVSRKDCYGYTLPCGDCPWARGVLQMHVVPYICDIDSLRPRS